MFIKKLSILFCVLIFLSACHKEETPKGIIEKDKMVNVLIDINLVDAYLSQVNNNDTMLMQAKARYNYVFKKYAIDSAKFSHSLNYYSKRTSEFDKMYVSVMDSLTRLEDKYTPKPKTVKKNRKPNDLSAK